MRKTGKIILFITIFTLVLLSFIGGNAYARYMSKITGNATAEIASWSFKVNDNKESMQTITLESSLNNKKLAPGTNGSFQIKLDANGSDVGINYQISFEELSIKPTNLIFKYDEGIYYTLSDLQTALSGIINTTNEDIEKTLIIEWEWPYETGNTPNVIAANDEIDRKDGQELTNYSFNINVSGTQVNSIN